MPQAPAPKPSAPLPNSNAAPVTERVSSSPADVIQEIWGEEWQVGIAIAQCESSLQADAVNTANADGSEDVGLFQINSIHGRSRGELLDPYANTRFAYTLFQAQGTAPWESSRLCWEGNVVVSAQRGDAPRTR